MGLIIGGTTPRKNQDLSGLVIQETGKSLVADTEIAKIHEKNADAETASSIATIISGVSADTIADADTVSWYQAIGGALKKITWANIIATIRTAILGSTSGILKANGSGVVSAASVGTDYQAPLTFGIAQDNAVKVSAADAASGEYAKFTATGLESKTTGEVLNDIGANDGKVIIGINDQSGTTYTLALSDAGKLVTCENANAITLTVPKNSVVAFPVNTVITIEQKGAGVVTTAPVDGDVTIVKYGGLKTAGQYACAQLLKIATNEWLFIGGVA